MQIVCGFVLFFSGNRWKIFFLEIGALLAMKFPTKLCVFQPSRSKTVGEDTFLADTSFTFQEKGKTHQNTSI